MTGKRSQSKDYHARAGHEIASESTRLSSPAGERETHCNNIHPIPTELIRGPIKEIPNPILPYSFWLVMLTSATLSENMTDDAEKPTVAEGQRGRRVIVSDRSGVRTCLGRLDSGRTAPC